MDTAILVSSATFKSPQGPLVVTHNEFLVDNVTIGTSAPSISFDSPITIDTVDSLSVVEEPTLQVVLSLDTVNSISDLPTPALTQISNITIDAATTAIGLPAISLAQLTTLATSAVNSLSTIGATSLTEHWTATADTVNSLSVMGEPTLSPDVPASNTTQAKMTFSAKGPDQEFVVQE